MRHLIIFFLFNYLVTSANGQSGLTFDKRLIECNRRWIATPEETQNKFGFSYVFIDPVEGLTLFRIGEFKVLANGSYTVTKVFDSATKYTLKPNDLKVALIPIDKYLDLDLKLHPVCMENYTYDTLTVKSLYRIGYVYNVWGDYFHAVGYLERARKLDSTINYVNIELGFTYNSLEYFEKARSLMKAVVENEPEDAYAAKEYIYALLKLGLLSEASENCRKAINRCIDTSFNGENCYNLIHNLYLKRDRKNFLMWLADAKKWNKGNSARLSSIDTMQDDLSR